MRIAVVGAGPAGLFGAISAATVESSADIVIFEATQKPLAKVLISGGGRCNVTHHCFDPAVLVKNYPRGHKELRGPFSRFQPRDTVAWFEKHGVRLKAEDDGRMFPVTNSSATIADCLLDAASKLGVRLRLGARVGSIKAVARDDSAPQFEIGLSDGSSEKFDRVLLATGSSPQGHRLAASLGLTMIPGVPSLFTFKINDPRLDGLAGTSFDNVTLTMPTDGKKKLVQSGPMLITHWGLSGPVVLKLSAWGARYLHQNDYQAMLKINLVPTFSAEQLTLHLRDYKENNGRKRVLSGADLPVPRRYWSRIAYKAGVVEITTWTNLTKAAMTTIIDELTNAQFAICGKGTFKDEFVTCGGVDLKGIDFRTMQIKSTPGLYVAGELLDIDGLTGGFNFQNAWTTGWIAGMSAAS